MAVKLSDDFKHELGGYFFVGESLLGNITATTSFTDVDGTQYILISDNGSLDPVNSSQPINAKTISLLKVITNNKIFK